MLLWARSNGATRVAAPGDPATLAELEAAGLVRRHGGDVELVPPEAVKGRPLIRVSRETTERPEVTDA
ncbi:hypothetical protein [Sorangium cellulosum]|uniref:Uncharacterized protein n=1 Tax=Sorangium cellulosum TaxID=56 RepID=A0A150QGS6_SORCE|nr:hypothetical protein [Sorangium cellulosum]KYF66848.1 hypothetical protein BE15_39105 [Sorangium cellulosum]